jgi:hypothetical protein
MSSNIFGSALVNRFFKPVNDAVWDLMSGTIGVKTDEGIASIIKTEEDGYQITLNIFDDFSVQIPAF